MINYIIVTHYQIQIVAFSISKRYLKKYKNTETFEIINNDLINVLFYYILIP